MFIDESAIESDREAADIVSISPNTARSSPCSLARVETPSSIPVIELSVRFPIVKPRRSR